ncbi:hypothetical protein AB5J62_43905 [Amycolatopsis sp. cg5]|uniref:hypothetical protein n=1 Tax=Amycolatopsis sp. cg5 TaxID=3238802 RepID=UPI003523B09C
MSYDLNFVRREPGQSWDEAFEEMAENASSGPLSAKCAAQWDRIFAEATTLLGSLDQIDDGDSRELVHEPTGIQLSFSDGDVTITVPHWHQGSAATKTKVDVYALADIVERETGLEGYDPQLDQPLSESRAVSAG